MWYLDACSRALFNGRLPRVKETAVFREIHKSVNAFTKMEEKESPQPGITSLPSHPISSRIYNRGFSIPAPSLPEPSPVRSRTTHVPSIGMFRSPHIIPMTPGRETREEHDESPEEEQDHSREEGPDRNRVSRHAAALIIAAIDVVLYDAEEHEVRRQHDDGEDPRQRGDEGGEERAADARAEREQEGDEGHAADDGVEDHDAREGLGGVFGRRAEGRLVGVGDDGGGVVADVARGAVVLIMLWTSDVESAVSECAQGDGGVACRCSIREGHLQHRDVVYDWR